MFSSIAAYFWGSSAAGASPEAETPPVDGLAGVTHDAITNGDVEGGEFTPAVETIPPSSASLSDEEAGWVFVNNNNNNKNNNNNTSKIANVSYSSTDTNLCEQEEEPLEVETSLESPEKKPTTVATSVPASRSTRNIPNSALHSSSVLTALAELRPQQKSLRRQKELHLKNKQMDRSNKVLQVNGSSNKPSRRRSMYSSTVYSRAVNNRKC